MIKAILNEAIDGFVFHDHPEAATGDGFNVPTDVKYNSIYLGTLVSKPDGYEIAYLDTPKGKQKISSNKQNKFKSKNAAAEKLHEIWRLVRNKGLF